MENRDETIPHPSEVELAAYLGGELLGDERARVEAHLADCSACRREIIDSAEILRSRPRVRWTVVAPTVAAAAVLALLFPTVIADSFLAGPVDHRDAPAEVRSAPSPLSPVGAVSEATTFVWARAPGADRYRITLFTLEGTRLWEATTVDSTVSLSDSLTLEPGQTYLWQVDARVGWDVWESSGLTAFVLEGPPTAPTGPGD